MSRAGGTRAAVPRFPDAPQQYDAGNEADFRRTLEQSITELIHAHTIKPAINVEADRSGSSATLQISILDYDRRVTAVEFNKREGSGAATGWVTTWDTSTGTIGTDAELIRTEAISIPEGLDSSGEWRVKWRDQRGTVHTEGGPIPLANLASLTKTLREPHTSFTPTTNATTWVMVAGGLSPSGAAGGQYRASIVLPFGATATGFRARLYRNAVGDSATATVYSIDNNGTATLQATASHSTTGWQTVSGSFSVAVADTVHLVLLAELTNSAATGDAVILWFDVDYTAPNYATTI